MSDIDGYEQLNEREEASSIYVPLELTVYASDPSLFYNDFFGVPVNHALIVEPVENAAQTTDSPRQWRARFIRLGSLATEDEYPFAD